MTIERRHIPFLLFTAVPFVAAIEPLLHYTTSTIHVTSAMRLIVGTIFMWRRHRIALPVVLVAYGVFTAWYLMRLRGTIVSGNFMSWECLIIPFGWALSPLTAAVAVLLWGESYVSPDKSASPQVP